MNASKVGYLFLRKTTLLTQGAKMGTEGHAVIVHDNLVIAAGCHDASGDLDYKPIDYE